MKTEFGEPLSPDPLAGELLGVLMHKLNNVTQLMEVVRSTSEMESAQSEPLPPAIAESRAAALGEAAESSWELGWLFGCLASAAGTEMLMERREPAGLRLLLDLVIQCLARRSSARRVCPTPGDLPQLSTSTEDGWSVAWLLGATVFEAALLSLGQDKPMAWSLRLSEGNWFLRVEGCPDGYGTLRTALQQRLRRVPSALLIEEPDGWSLALPEVLLVRGLADG